MFLAYRIFFLHQAEVVLCPVLCVSPHWLQRTCLSCLVGGKAPVSAVWCSWCCGLPHSVCPYAFESEPFPCLWITCRAGFELISRSSVWYPLTVLRAVHCCLKIFTWSWWLLSLLRGRLAVCSVTTWLKPSFEFVGEAFWCSALLGCT